MHRRKNSRQCRKQNDSPLLTQEVSEEGKWMERDATICQWLSRQELGGVILVFLLSTGMYWDTLNYDFVHDDIVAILRNPDVRQTTPWTNLLVNDYWGTPMWSPLSHKSYRPLTVLTFRLNFGINNGLSAFWFHLTNVLIHAGVSVLFLFLCTRRLGMTLSTALITSTVFALHPIHTEAVAGITGRSDALACFLMLISFLLYSGSFGQKEFGGRNITTINNGGTMALDWPWSLLCSGLVGCLAMLAKETGITVLGINVAFDVYIHLPLIRRWVSTKSEDGGALVHLRRRLTLMVTLGTLSLILRLVVMNGTFPKFGEQDNPASHAASGVTRFLTYGFLPVFNFWLILCPHHLSYDWQMGSIPLLNSVGDPRNLATLIFYPAFGLFIIQAVTKLRVNSLRKRRILLAILFIALPFLPASNLLFPVGFVAAERVLYTPSLGISILTGTGFQLLKDRYGSCGRFRKAVISGTICLILLSFSLKSIQRNAVWKSRASLFESGLRENPGNAKVHYNYGNLQKDLGNKERALNHYKTATSLWPGYASAWNNLGAVSEDKALAERSFLNALRSNPQHAGAHFNLGVIYLRSGRDLEAMGHLEEVVFRLDPSHMEALRYLGICYNRLNKTEEAVGNVFRKLISSDLPPSSIHGNFGLFLQEMGRGSEALTHYLLALTVSPPMIPWTFTALLHGVKLAAQLEAHQLLQKLSLELLKLEFEPSVAYMLARSYAQEGKVEEAKSLFEKLIAESNSFYRIHYAQFLIDVRQWSTAEVLLTDLVRGNSDDPSSLLLLARVLEDQNRTAEAFDTLHSSLHHFCPRDKGLCSVFYSQLGNIMHTAGAATSAAHYYSMAIQYDPKSVQAHANIGAIYHLMSKYEEARRHYAWALEIEPSNTVVRLNVDKLQRAQESETSSRRRRRKVN